MPLGLTGLKYLVFYFQRLEIVPRFICGNFRTNKTKIFGLFYPETGGGSEMSLYIVALCRTAKANIYIYISRPLGILLHYFSGAGVVPGTPHPAV